MRRSDLIGHPLQYIRVSKGWTQEKLAHEMRALSNRQGVNLATSAKTVAKWEHGVEPEEASQLVLAELLGISPSVVGRISWPDWLPKGEVPGIDRDWGSPGEAIEALRELVEAPAVNRRDFLVLSGSSLLTPVYEWMTKQVVESLTSTRGLRLSTEEINQLATASQAIRLMSEKAGSGAVRNMSHAHLELALALLRNCSYGEAAGRRLYSWAAEAAQLAGFNSFDLSDQAGAQRYWAVALRLAHTADDISLGANTVGFLSYQFLSQGRVSEASRLAQLGLENLRRSGSGSPKVHAMLAGRVALAAGMAGETKKCGAATDEALLAIERSAAEPEPQFTSWIDDGHVHGVVGRAFLQLGNAAQAEEHLMQATDPSLGHTRSRALYLGQLARVGFLKKDIDFVCTYGRAAWEVVSQIESRRVQRGIERLAVDLRDYDDNVEAHALITTLTTGRAEL